MSDTMSDPAGRITEWLALGGLFNPELMPPDKTRALIVARAENAEAALAASERPCTCHPDDNPPVPCAKRYALTECKAAAYDVLRQRLRDWHRVADERSAEIVRLSARLAEAEALLRLAAENKKCFYCDAPIFVHTVERIEAFLSADSATQRENERE